MAYEVMDKSIEDDSDSDFEPHSARRMSGGAEGAMANLSLNMIASSPPKQPPRPIAIPPKPPVVRKEPSPEPESEEEDDADNPFADSYAVKTPAVEKSGMKW